MLWLDLGRFASSSEGDEDDGTDSTSADATFYILPVELVASWRKGDWTLSPGAIFTKIAVSGEYDEDQFEGAVAVTNLQLYFTTEWRVSDSIALLLHLRWLAYQDTSAAGTLTLNPDPYTEVEVISDGSSDLLDYHRAASAVASIAFSWEVFNLRLGLGYGNYSIPLLNFVVPHKTPIPELDLYWRW